MRSKATGIIYVVCSAILYGVCAVLTKFVSAMGVTVACILVGRGAIGALLALAGCGLTKKSLKLKKENLPKVFIMGLFGMCATLLLLNLAYNQMPVGTVTTIHYLYPVLVCVASTVMFKEKLSPVAWATVVLCFAGVALMSGASSGGSNIGIILSALSAVAWTFYMMYMEHSGVLGENKLTLTFYMCIVLMLFGLSYGTATRSLNFENFLPGLPILIAIGFLNNIVASVLFQKGVEKVGAGLSSILSVFEPISSIAFGALIMKESLSKTQIVGCGVVLAAVLLLMIYNTKKKRNT